jgi:hypothetical protein
MNRTIGMMGAAWVAVAGCTQAVDGQAPMASSEQTANDTSDLIGTVSYASDCNSGHKAFLDKVMFYGRVAAASPAFKACIDNLVAQENGPARYMQCNEGGSTDPFYGFSSQEQSNAVLKKTLSPNPLTIHCTGGAGNASAIIGAYDQMQEEFNFSAWLNNVYQATPPAGDPTWPVWQAAAITWHEVMHQYGYHHGNGPASECGITGADASTFNFQVNTMPYLVQGCLGSVISESGQKCGSDFATACGSNKLKLVKSLGGTSCECVADPKVHKTVAGFVWAQQSTGTFNADASYSYSSAGATNKITSLGTGSYRVDFPSIGASGGNAQATAYGSGSNYCNVDNWTNSGSTEQVFVKCYNKSGSAANSQFTASYVRQQGATAFASGLEGAYALADNPTSSSYTPSISNQWSSTLARAKVTRSATGTYQVSFPELTFLGGDVQVTAFNTSNRCKVESWFDDSVGTKVNVGCFTPSGSRIDKKFSVLFNSFGVGGTPAFAYAWADQPSTASYTPSTTYQDGSIGGGLSTSNFPPQDPITISRADTGLYDVTLPTAFDWFPAKTHYKVTGYGSGAEHCKVVFWGSLTARVACFNASGNAVDTRFTIAHSSDLFVIP